MHALPRFAWPAAFLLLLGIVLGSVSIASAFAAPPASVAPAAAPASLPAPVTIPDYGGRDSAPLSAPSDAPNPAAQAGRAVEALVIVLVGVVGVVYALRRFGWVKPGINGQPAKITLTGRVAANAGTSPVAVLSSQSLPGGAMLHVVQVDDRCLLLAATAQSVTNVAEWPASLTTSDDAAGFEEYLARADNAPNSGIAAANARLRSLLSRPDLEEHS
jgi:flagellar biogenesis protein FliO